MISVEGGSVVFKGIETGQPLRLAGLSAQSDHLLVKLKTLFDEPANRQRIDPVLGTQHSRRERLLIVASQHRYRCLDDDRTTIEFTTDQVHSCPVDLDPGPQGLLMRPQARERWQQ